MAEPPALPLRRLREAAHILIAAPHTVRARTRLAENILAAPVIRCCLRIRAPFGLQDLGAGGGRLGS
jgi:hypothetical protein